VIDGNITVYSLYFSHYEFEKKHGSRRWNQLANIRNQTEVSGFRREGNSPL